MMEHLVVSDRGDYVEAVSRGPWSAAATDAYIKGGASRLVLNCALGYVSGSLDFLKELPVKGLVLLDRSINDLEPIYSLAPMLRELELTTDPSLRLDVSRFDQLVHLGADWEQVRDSIVGALYLEHVFLLRYRATDFSPLTPLKNLMGISLKDRPSLRSLAGLSELRKMRKLGIFLARDLQDVSDLRGSIDLEELELEACRKVSDICEIAECKRLKLLNLSDCGEIASAKPLRGLSRLEYLYLWGNTKFMDGDVSAIASLTHLKDLRMRNHRHYRPSAPDIQAVLADGT